MLKASYCFDYLSKFDDRWRNCELTCLDEWCPSDLQQRGTRLSLTSEYSIAYLIAFTGTRRSRLSYQLSQCVCLDDFQGTFYLMRSSWVLYCESLPILCSTYRVQDFLAAKIQRNDWSSPQPLSTASNYFECAIADFLRQLTESLW